MRFGMSLDMAGFSGREVNNGGWARVSRYTLKEKRRGRRKGESPERLQQSLKAIYKRDGKVLMVLIALCKAIQSMCQLRCFSSMGIMVLFDLTNRSSFVFFSIQPSRRRAHVCDKWIQCMVDPGARIVG